VGGGQGWVAPPFYFSSPPPLRLSGRVEQRKRRWADHCQGPWSVCVPIALCVIATLLSELVGRRFLRTQPKNGATRARGQRQPPPFAMGELTLCLQILQGQTSSALLTNVLRTGHWFCSAKAIEVVEEANENRRSCSKENSAMQTYISYLSVIVSCRSDDRPLLGRFPRA